MDINHKNINGETCLHIACMCNDNIDVITYLILDQNMDPNQISNNGMTCLHSACCEKNNLEVIRYLIENKIWIRIKIVLKGIHV